MLNVLTIMTVTGVAGTEAAGAPTPAFYPIGTPGQKWGESEVKKWRESRTIQRSYQDEVVKKIDVYERIISWKNTVI